MENKLEAMIEALRKEEELGRGKGGPRRNIARGTTISMNGFQIAEYFPLRLTSVRREIDRGSFMTCPCMEATEDRASTSMGLRSSIIIHTF